MQNPCFEFVNDTGILCWSCISPQIKNTVGILRRGPGFDARVERFILLVPLRLKNGELSRPCLGKHVELSVLRLICF